MTDIVSHIVTIGFGLLLFFAILHELVMTFRRKKKCRYLKEKINYTNCRCKTCGGIMDGDGYNVVLHCETLDATELYLEPDADPVYCKPQEKDKDKEV